MELRQLRYFVAVAEGLHFGRAAKALSMSQPPLSQQIRALEVELGVELLKRTKREVRLTPAGRAFLDRARKLLEEIEHSAEVVRRAARGQTGSVEVGYAPPSDLGLIPSVVRRFRVAFPGVHVSLHPLSTADQLNALRDSRIELGFLRLPVVNGDIRVEAVLKEPLILAAPRGHPLARLSRVPLKSLADEPCVFIPRQEAPQYHDHVLGQLRKRGLSPRIAWEIPCLYDKLSLIAAGAGVALVARSVQKIRRDDVVYLRLEAPALHVEMGVAYRRRDLSEVSKALLGIVRRQARV